jgi:cell wall-associated NlpC family hydrolase
MARLGAILGVFLLVGGCASTGGVPRPFPLPGGATSPPPVSGGTDPADPTAPGIPRRPNAPVGSADGYSISSTALSFRGAPYRDGGADPAGFDCSGFVQYVFAQHGVSMPRETRRQYELGNDVDMISLEPGDLVFFTTVAPGASHVGIVVGGDQFVHAPSNDSVVRIDHLSAQYWANRFVGAKRVN